MHCGSGLVPVVVTGGHSVHWQWLSGLVVGIVRPTLEALAPAVGGSASSQHRHIAALCSDTREAAKEPGGASAIESI